MATPRDIVALDLATRTGWARWRAGDEVHHGTIALPETGPEVGRFLAAFDDRLVSVLAVAPDVVVFEAPWVGSDTHQATARKLMGLAGHVEFVCYRAGIACCEVNNNTVRKHFCGKGNAPRKAMKAMVIAACRDRGWSPANDDEADALAMLDYAAHVYRLDIPWVCGALFGRSA